jgi:ribosomal protein S18 acetylase RimI-like enzyme
MSTHFGYRLRAALPEGLKRPLRPAYQSMLSLVRREPLPPLLMRYGADVPPVVAPLKAPFTWKMFEPTDFPAWLELLNANGELGRWTAQSLAAETKELMPGTQHFVINEGRLVAGAGAYDRPMEHGVAWELRCVARRPEYKGAGLGEQVVAAAVTSALQLSPRPIVLFTDDHRIAGIGLYLRLGFVPDLEAHPSYRARWQAVGDELARLRGETAVPRGFEEMTGVHP